MMWEVPKIERVIDHRGSFTRIANWLLNSLDSLPPPVGGHLVLYLCYHISDGSLFSLPERNSVLGRALLNSYEQELRWDGMVFGDLRFDLSAHNPDSLSLTVRDARGVNNLVEKAVHKTTPSRPTLLEFYWEEGQQQVAPGTLGLVRRFVEPLATNTVMKSSLKVISDGNASIRRHIDVWQRNIRGSQPSVYLPRGISTISIGAVSGCDIRAPQLESPLIVEYDSAADQWKWETPAAPWMPHGVQKGDFLFEHESGKGRTPIVLKGQRLTRAQSLNEIGKENRLPLFVMEIVGCLLPIPNNQIGYAVPAAHSVLSGLAASATELPGGAWLYCMRDSRLPYLLRAGEAPPGRALRRDGVAEELRLFSDVETRLRGKWIEYPQTFLPFFCGELRLTPPLSSRLAADVISGDLPHEIFPGYVDSNLGRPPVRLESSDGRSYKLAFNPSAKHPVFLFLGTRSSVERYDPSPIRTIDLGAGAEFILGTTHYRLSQLPDSMTDEVSAS